MVCVTLSNIHLIDIPTQSRRISFKIKQGRNKYSSPSMSIHENTVAWQEPIEMDCRAPKTPKKKEVFRVSFRLEGVNGSKFSRYGNIILDLASIKASGTESVLQPLNECQYQTKFQANIKFSAVKAVPIALPRKKKANIDKNRRKTAPQEGFPQHLTQSVSLDGIHEKSKYSVLSFNNETSDVDYEPTLPIAISEDKLATLEQQVDEILGSVLRYRNLG